MVYKGFGARSNIGKIIANAANPMFVCEQHHSDTVSAAVQTGESFVKYVQFGEFTANPKYADIQSAIARFEDEGCDFLVSIGGGSAIDVAKCINILRRGDEIVLRNTPRCNHLALPTTAGSGSEATHFAVLYKDEKKLSIAHANLTPGHVILDPGFLETLPPYHKKSSMLDAFCQSIESLWAKGANTESKEYAKEAIRIIKSNVDGYLYPSDVNTNTGASTSAGTGTNADGCGLQMLIAANLSGKAINITKTTAAHAMSYGLTTHFNIAHGHAVAMCLPHVWEHLSAAGRAPECLPAAELDKFLDLFRATGLPQHIEVSGIIEVIVDRLVDDVNVERLGNHPVPISKEELAVMYRKICG